MILRVAVTLLLAACNYPGLPGQQPSGMELQQTMQALVTAGLSDQATAMVLTQTVMPSTPDNPATPGSSLIPTLLPTAAPTMPGPTPTPVGPIPTIDAQTIRYISMPGDTLRAVAAHFGADPAAFQADVPIPSEGLLSPGSILRIDRLAVDPQAAEAAYPDMVLPDSEIVNSPTAADFDVAGYIAQAGGYLSTYTERVSKETLTGAQIVQRVATESSVNPRFLLAWIELRTGWVVGRHPAPQDSFYPLGFKIPNWERLYKELVISSTHLHIGYYGWRDGSLSEITYRNGRKLRLAPGLNAGTVGLQNLFTRLYDEDEWAAALYGVDGISAVYRDLFGDPWGRSTGLGPLYPPNLAQPKLALPFLVGERWSLTSGPHVSWKTGSPRGAIDFAPAMGEGGCAVSRHWTTAPAGGRIARSDRNVVALDLDGDGLEQTGWVIIFLHLADAERIAAGTVVKADDPLGHPSCEGGQSTGLHTHIARKYNGEWLLADGPLPFVLGGWRVVAYEQNYKGEMRNGDLVAISSTVGQRTSLITR